MVDMDGNNGGRNNRSQRETPSSFYQPNNYDRQYYPEQSREQYIRNDVPKRSAFLEQISNGLKDVDEYQKKLTTVEQGYNKMLNDQVDIIAKISKARSAEETRAYKTQLKYADQYADEQLRILKRTYAEERRYLNKDEREKSRLKIKNAEKDARDILKVVKKIDSDMYKQMNEGSTASLLGKFNEFASSIGKAYTAFNINQLVSSGIQGAQSNVSNTNQLQKQNALSNSQSYNVGKDVKEAVREQLGSSMRTSEVMQYVGQAGQLVGGNDTKQIAEITKTLAARGELGLGNDVTASINTARAMGIDPNQYLKTLTDQQATLSRTQTKDGNTFRIRQEDLARQLDSFQSGLAANITDPQQLQSTNRNLMGMLASYQNESPTASEAVTNVLQNAINNPSAASGLGISSVEVNKALASGNTDKLNEIIFNASDRLSKSGDNALLLGQALGLDPEGVNAFKSINSNKNAIAQNTQLAQTAKIQSSDDLISDGQWTKGGTGVQKALRPVFDKITSIGEWASAQLGVDPTDINSQLSTIINLLVAITSSDIIKTGSKLFGLDGLGGSIASKVSAKLLGKGAASSVGGGMLSGLTGGGGLSALTGKGVLQAFGKVGGPLAIGTSVVTGIMGALNADKVLGSAKGATLTGKFATGISAALAGNGKGGILGALGNGAKGAAIGTMIAPGIGTAIGGLLGAVLGGIGYEDIAKFLTGGKGKTKKGNIKSSPIAQKEADNSKTEDNVLTRIQRWFTQDTKDAKEAKKNSHKDGLATVPKDDYKATLHKDEAVLTKEQANTWREQQRGASTTSFMKEAIKNANFTEMSKTINKIGGGSSEDSSSGSKDSKDVDASKVTAKQTGQAFVDSIGKAAMVNYKRNDMLPSFFIAQAAWESAGGTSYLARTDNNLGGNKMPNKWASRGGSYPTDGTGGQYAHFDTKNDWAMGQVDYYAGNMGRGVRGQKSIEGTVRAIRENGYFTAPIDAYLAGVRSQIKQYNLEEFDRKNGVKAAAYEQGTPWVPNTQVALVHKGEMIVPEEHNPNNPKNANKVNVKNTGLDSSLEQILTWGFNKVVDAIIATNETNPLGIPNIPPTPQIRN